MRNSAKLAALLAVGASAAFLGCSSSDDSSTGFGGSGNSSGSTSHAGTSSGGTSAQAGTGTGVSGGGATGVAGATAGSGGAAAGSGGAAAGTGGAAAGTGGAAAGSGGAAAGSGGAAAGTGGGGGTGGGNNAVVTACGGRAYTKTGTPGGVCAATTPNVPTVPGISNFDDGTAAGWGVYANGTGGTITPATATPSAPGADGTAKSLSFVVAGAAKGIRVEAGFGNVCQDVRTFTGLTFWAKGTIDAATTPTADFPVDANNLVITLGAEKSAQGGCTGTCSNAPDLRLPITSDWKQYEIPFACLGDGLVFDGYFTDILFNAYGTNSNFAIDQVGYY